jgi:TRAP-type C4-dicarboxylate transport system substrate-binding protein
MAATRRGIMAAGAGLALRGAMPATAQTRWRASVPWSDGNSHSRNLRHFLDEVRLASGGTLDVTLHTSGTLLTLTGTREGLQRGQAQIADLLLSAEADLDPILELDSLPMLVRSLEGARQLATLTRPLIERCLRRVGITVLYLAPWPPPGLFSGFVVDSLADLRGTRMRAVTPIASRLVSLAGAISSQPEAEERPLSYGAPLARAMFASASSGVDLQVWSFARFYMPLDMSFPKNALCIQSRAWDALPARLRAVMREAAAAAEERAWALASSERPVAQKVLASHGVTMMPPSARLLAELEQLGQTMLEEWRARAGASGARVLAALRAG